MDWKNHYNSHVVSAAEAVKHIKSGDRIATSHACGSPELLITAMLQRKTELRDVEIVHMVAMGKAVYCQPEYRNSFRHVSIFAGGPSRSAIADSRAEHIPCFFSQIPALFDTTLPISVAMVTVSKPDAHGFVSLGVSVDYTKDAVEKAQLVIAEVNPNMPRIGGDSFIHVSKINYFVEVDTPIIPLSPPQIGEIEMAIGKNVASLVKDGDCLQLGIGAIPDAALRFLGDKKDLGIHSEMISDGVMVLVEKGVITGAAKSIHRNKIIITFAMGTAEFYKWLDNNVQVEIYPVSYVNDPRVIAKNDNLVSINSAISVYLLGQVAADMIGSKQFSGVGGQVDFVRGAAWSKNGRSIIAMPATAAKDTVSKISLNLEIGQGVTTSRYDVDYIVTEYGIAALKGRNMRQRAAALIAIAAPKFRDELIQQAQELYGWIPNI